MDLELYFAGATCGIWMCPGAKASWDQANGHIREKHQSQLPARLSLLADKGSLRSPDHMNAEGDGIHAAKANCGLRAYGWFSNVQGKKAFIISHVIYKDQQKLDPQDLTRAVGNRDVYEKEQQK